MSDYIDRKALIEATEETQFTMSHFPNKDQCDGANMARLTFASIFRILPAIDAVPVVRCRDCKWRPRNMGMGVEHHLSFPLDNLSETVCPYAAGDPWYNVEPDPNGFATVGSAMEVAIDDLSA